MKTYRPIKSNWLTQGFGDNRCCAKTDISGGLLIPTVIQAKTGAFCDIGFKDFYKLIGMKGHNGMDWMTWHGEPVYFCDEFEGWTRHENDTDGGLGVDIVSNKPEKYCEVCKEKHFIKRRFWHGMDRGGESALVGFEQRKVKLGDLVMYADNTGASSGDHLHTSLKWCDVFGNGIHQENGYFGAFPDEDFENIFVGDIVKLMDLKITLIGLLKSYLINLQAQLYAKSH
jgi:hypothetical protein